MQNLRIGKYNMTELKYLPTDSTLTDWVNSYNLIKLYQYFNKNLKNHLLKDFLVNTGLS